MKKVFSYIAVAALATVVACGNGEAEKEKARLDSLRQDSIKQALQAEMDKAAQAMQDSLKKVHEADSIRLAEEAAAKAAASSTKTSSTKTSTSTTTKTEESSKGGKMSGTQTTTKKEESTQNKKDKMKGK